MDKPILKASAEMSGDVTAVCMLLVFQHVSGSFYLLSYYTFNPTALEILHYFPYTDKMIALFVGKHVHKCFHHACNRKNK